MKNYLLIPFVIALMFLAFGCNPAPQEELDSNDSVQPSTTQNAIQTFSFEVEIDGTFYPGTIRYSTIRTAQTTMDAILLRDYFAIETVNQMPIPGSAKCFAYSQACVKQGTVLLGCFGVRGAMNLLPDTQIYGTVFIWEMFFGTIPDSIPPEDYPCN